MYQTGSNIRDTIESIQKHEYVLPAIQRQFVWSPEQIARLFDSLMQGFPIGTFLFWRVEAENASKYRFYDFVRDYHKRDNPRCPRLPEQRNALTAILDGQQRLTALNIGLTGSLAIKLKNKWRNNPDAFPTRHLYLNLLSGVEPDEDGDLYTFEFLSRHRIETDDSASRCWFRVSEIMSMEDGPEMLQWLNERLPQEKANQAYKTLDRLYRLVHSDNVVAYYEEKSQDLSRVLNIFIRLNSGGTVLSYSDLLLSIAVFQWKRLDAREEIPALVDDLNQTGEQFDFSQDLVLKAGLVLTDIGNVGFKVENFDEANMTKLEDRWPQVRRALQLTVHLFASFGYNGQNLRATSVILPVAYYLNQIDPGERYLTVAAYAEDRSNIQAWIAKSLLKASGIWGSGLDTLLSALRETIRIHGQERFPIEELESQMARRGKSLVFEDEEIQELCDLKYGNARTFSLLTLLFPAINLTNHFHVDHVFPRSRFTKTKLKSAGIEESLIEDFPEKRDLLANLQLLSGSANIEKQSKLPSAWLSEYRPNEDSRRKYCEEHLLGSLPETMDGFLEFYDTRREAMQQRIQTLLNRSTASGNNFAD